MPRLARAPGEDRLRGLLNSPLGALATRPWFDRLALRGLLRWYFPLSRLWAAGCASTGDPDRFAEATGCRARPALLAALQRAQAAAAAAEARWQDAAFAPVESGSLAAVERGRRLASHALMSFRGRFAPLVRPSSPRLRWDVPGPDAMPAAFGGRRPRPEDLYGAPGEGDVRQSHGFDVGHARVSWLRFTSPDLGDVVTARVIEPRDAPRATVVVGHGLMVEGEQWRSSVGTGEALAELGLRAVELTAPWHGRRALPGWYGGEPFLGTAPLGPLRLFAAQVRECAMAIAWCRARWGGPVGLAGISMGSLVAQLVASHCGAWPATHRPDAVLLITHHGDLAGVLRDSDLAKALGMSQALAAVGWTDATLAPWADLADPAPRPTLPSESIVSLLAAVDVITPFVGGRATVSAWDLPAENRFIVPGGHFTASLRVSRNRLAITRLATILAQRS